MFAEWRNHLRSKACFAAFYVACSQELSVRFRSPVDFLDRYGGLNKSDILSQSKAGWARYARS